MPPKKASKSTNGATAAASSTPSLAGCHVALSGTFSGKTHHQIANDLESLGGVFERNLSGLVTHLITTQIDVDKPSAKVAKATGSAVFIVKYQWLQDCMSFDARQNEDNYLFGSRQGTPISSGKGPAAGSTAKRTATSADLDNSVDAEPAAKKHKTDATAATTHEKKDLALGQVAQSSDLQVPLDEECTLTSYSVYIDDDDGVIWDGTLNQTDSAHNSNKFYRIQLLQDGSGEFKTWTRWGRVGDRGQTRILGNGSLEDAKSKFKSKFKGKSGLAWEDRASNPIRNKYAFVERSYNPDSDDDLDESQKSDQKDENDKAEWAPPVCTLERPVQELMELIFDEKFFAAAMNELNYDVGKLPLGKLSRATITRGFQALKDLAAIFDDSKLAMEKYGTERAEATEMLSNRYYSLIPHAFGRNRPPVIQRYDQLKKEISLLESLGDMKDAELIMKIDRAKVDHSIHPLNQRYDGLGMVEMTALDSSTTEFTELEKYLLMTRAATHSANYSIESIFRIERQGECNRFAKKPPSNLAGDRRLLWHGSRVTNFGGILSQGLRIAPPEAPVSGYMFGKGIYLADMSSKSANYCFSYSSDSTALLLLCEAEVGNPPQALVQASYTAAEDAKAAGKLSTLGQGRSGPLRWKDAECVHPDLAGVGMPDVSVLPGPTRHPNASLLYNEYIVYDVAQVRLRYLFRIKM